MAAQTLILQHTAFGSSPRYDSTTISLHSSYSNHIHTHSVSKPHGFIPSTTKPYFPISRKSKIFASSSSSSSFPTDPPTNSSNLQTPTQYLLTGSTRTITTLLAITLSVSRLFSEKIKNLVINLKGICNVPNPDEMLALQGVQDSVVCAMGPMFFAAMNRGPRALNTPLTVVAAGMSKWLEIYSAVLMVRVLLSWFPNIPWDRQPLSAIRDLCDPYLNLFRNIIPPLFDTLDVSPLLAFAVLGSLAGILGASTRPY